jgi:hypothetical protein
LTLVTEIGTKIVQVRLDVPMKLQPKISLKSNFVDSIYSAHAKPKESRKFS